MKICKQAMASVLALCVVAGTLPLGVCQAQAAETTYPDAQTIRLQSTAQTDGTYTHSATVNGTAVEEFDYTWHANPGEAHGEVKNCPAEYYTGTKPDTDAAVYIAHDITYYPELDKDSFKKVNYNGEYEWAYYYTCEEYSDYIFATLPVSGKDVPTQMMHSAEEAYENAVLHITQPGTYVLEGEWHGQIWIDLGDEDDVFSDEDAKVTVVLNGVDVTCTVAAALVFRSVYECDNGWEDRAEYSAAVDTTNAGAQVIVADGTENNFSGTNIYRMLKTAYKSSSSNSAVPVQKKARKIDAAFYSFMSMNIDGEMEGTGVLNVTSGFEGLDSELHLTINGANVNINAQDDGINVNEDGVSVVTINGGNTHILAGLGSEGDGIDSNGFLTVNGGTLISMASPIMDSGMDSDCGTYINGGTVVALGSTMDWAESNDDATGTQATMNLQFSASESADEAIIVTDTQGNIVFAYDPDKDEVTGSNARSYRGAILSSPNFEVGSSYYVYVGGDVYGTETAGIYDVSTVTGFSEEAAQQCYTSTTDLGGRPGGFGGGMPGNFDPDNLPDGFDPGEKREPPEGFDGENGERPQRPEDMGGMGELPEDFDPSNLPENFDPSQMGGFGGMGDMGGSASGDGEIVFTLSKQVNSFSGVMDYAPGNGSLPFSDVKSESWYYDAVQYVYEKGLMQGGSANAFQPTATTSRSMIVQILYNREGKPEGTYSSHFNDVAAGAWYTAAVEWAAETGIVSGNGVNAFLPNGDIAREQMAVILYNYAAYAGYDTTARGDLSAFKDSGSIHDWASEAMRWCVGTGLLKGSNNALNPLGTASRAEIAQVLMNFETIFGGEAA